MKLSRTAWNNVIIFSVMAMILIINIANDHLYPDIAGTGTVQERSLIAKQGVILTLTIANKVYIERAGTDWQSRPEIMSAQALEQMMLAWQQNTGYLIESQPIDGNSKKVEVKLELAGISDVQVYRLYPQADQLLIHQLNGDVWLSASLQIYQQLMPVQVVEL